MTDKETLEIKKAKDQKKRSNKFCYILIALAAGLSSISDMAVQYFMKDELDIEPATMTRLTSLIYLPWMLKPIFGFLTDLCPIFGYRRKIYIIMTGILPSVCWLILAYHTKALIETVSLLFVVMIGMSFSTVLGEAIVVELSQLEEDKEKMMEESKNYVSLFFTIKCTGSLTSSYLKGALLEIITIRQIFLISAFVPMFILLSGILFKEVTFAHQTQAAVQLSESTDDTIESNELNENRLQLNVNQNEQEVHLTACQLFSLFFRFLSQKKVYIPTLFIIMYMATPSYGDPFFYFLTNSLHFSSTELGKISFCSTLANLIAIISYRYYLKDVNFKTLITICSILTFTFNSLAFIVVGRYNVGYIDDFWLCLASNSLTSGLGELIMMPMLSLACQLCPKNLEGSVYSFFMSALNFGGIMSGLNGSFLTSMLSITSNDFSKLPEMIVITNVISIIPLLLLCCIDNKYFSPPQEEDFQNKIV